MSEVYAHGLFAHEIAETWNAIQKPAGLVGRWHGVPGLGLGPTWWPVDTADCGAAGRGPGRRSAGNATARAPAQPVATVGPIWRMTLLQYPFLSLPSSG